MSVLRRALEQRSLGWSTVPGNPAGTTGWQQGMVWRGSSAYGHEQAMQLSAVFACIRTLSELVATFPLDTYRYIDGQAVEVEPPMWLRFPPPGPTRIETFGQIMVGLLTDGNAYCPVVRSEGGGPVDYIAVLDPGEVSVRKSNGVMRYGYNGYDVDGTDLMHVKGMMFPGDSCGMSPLRAACQAVGLGLAAQDFGRSFFENGATPSAVIEAPSGMSQEAVDRFRASWYSTHGGQGQQQKVGVLVGDAKFAKVSIQPDEAQFLESRQFQVADIARFYGVPNHLIGDASGSTSWGSGLAEQNQAFQQLAIRPWVVRIEEALDRVLLMSDPGVKVKFNIDAALRSATTDRYNAHKVGLDAGFLTVNEVRALEDLPPLDESQVKDSPNEQAMRAQAAYALFLAGYEPTQILDATGLPPLGRAAPKQEDAST